ncbi:hypothetical protein [Sutterella sp.]|uniref:hypothetical protein n=1 Tax=Sutterella sp. TaxID=1981025 RepID=UPI003FD75B76
MHLSRRSLLLFVFCVANLFAGSLYSWSVFSGPLTAADLGFIFSIATGINPVAMISGGWVNDRFGPKYVLSAGQGDVTLFLAGLVLAAACYGSFVGVFPGLTVETFGLKYNSVNYGIMAAGFSSAGVLGPVLLKTLFTPEGFTNAYLAAEAVCAAGLGLVLLLVCRRMKAGEGAAS